MMTKAMQEREQVGVVWMTEDDKYYYGTGSYVGLLAYIAIPENHPCVGEHYNLHEDCEVNGGLTFASDNVFGWDYAHAYNSFDIQADIKRAIEYFKQRETKQLTKGDEVQV